MWLFVAIARNGYSKVFVPEVSILRLFHIALVFHCTTVLTLDCGPAPKIPNGFVLSGRFMVGTTREIGCQPGYTLVGPGNITCKTDGQWHSQGSNTCVKRNATF